MSTNGPQQCRKCRWERNAVKKMEIRMTAAQCSEDFRGGRLAASPLLLCSSGPHWRLCSSYCAIRFKIWLQQFKICSYRSENVDCNGLQLWGKVQLSKFHFISYTQQPMQSVLSNWLDSKMQHVLLRNQSWLEETIKVLETDLHSGEGHRA